MSIRVADLLQTPLYYLDNAASEPIRPSVAAEMQEIQGELQKIGANPSSSHRAGRIAAAVLEESRARIARALGSDPAEVIFTGGGSESVALAVIALALGSRSTWGTETVVHSAVEHESVTAAAEFLNQADSTAPWQTVELSVDRQGVVELPGVERLLAWKPAVLTILAVGNENGVYQPVSDLVKQVQAAREEMAALAEKSIRQAVDSTPEFRERKTYKNDLESWCPVHTDAMQALGRMPLNFHELGVEALSATGHKFGGPASGGLLLVKRNVNFRSPLKAAGQERAFRGGTQDVVNAVGLAAAVEAAQAEQAAQALRHQELRERLWAGVSQLSGVRMATEAAGVPGIIQLLLDGCEAEGLLLALDQAGVCASAGSACHTGVARPSKVLLAQGYTEAEALGVLRLSFGWNTSEADIDALLAALPRAQELSQKMIHRRQH